MAARKISVNILLKRPEGTEVPENILYGEPVFLEDAEALYIGKRDGSAFLVNPPASQEQAFVHFGPTPPTDDKLLWVQVVDGAIADRWQKTTTGLWVSQETYLLDAFEFEVKRNLKFPKANPCPTASVWIDTLTASAWMQDQVRNDDYIDFELGLVNTAQQQTPFFFLRLENAAKGDIFRASEFVGEAVAANEAMAIFLNIKRRGQSKLKTASMAVTLRRVYAEN